MQILEIKAEGWPEGGRTRGGIRGGGIDMQRLSVLLAYNWRALNQMRGLVWMSSTGLCGPQQARSWMKACYDVSTGSDGWEHLGSKTRSHPDSSCLKGEKKNRTADLKGYCVCVYVCVRPVLLCLCTGKGFMLYLENTCNMYAEPVIIQFLSMWLTIYHDPVNV